jgi:regulator of sigma E protease
VEGYTPDATPEELGQRTIKVREAIGKDRRCDGALVAGCAATSEAVVVYERNGVREQAKIAPRYDAELDRFLLGFAFGRDAESVGPLQAASLTTEGMWNVTTITVQSIVKIFYDSEAREQVSGVVGSYETTRQSFEFDLVRALTVLALISLSLAVINLFPFLPLDGGHIFWAVAEKVSGRKIPLMVMERASIIGIMLVAFLFLVGLSNDLGRITSGEGFGVR